MINLRNYLDKLQITIVLIILGNMIYGQNIFDEMHTPQIEENIETTRTLSIYRENSINKSILKINLNNLSIQQV